MAATGKVIGTVTAVVGEAKATAADGTVRLLQVGDKVYSDEAISTSESGSINVALEGGKTLACDGSVELALHESILNVAQASTPSASDIDAIQRAIATGQDPSQVAAATAAGGAPAAGGSDLDGGSHDPVVLEQGNAASVVSSGFDTEGASFTFATPQTESLQVALAVVSTTTPNSNSEHSNSPSPASTVLESLIQGNVAADEPAIITVIESTPTQGDLPAITPVIESTPAQGDLPAIVEIVVQPAVDAPAPNQPAAVEPTFEPVASNDEQAADEIFVVVPTEPTDTTPVEDTTSSNDQPVIIETGEEQQDAQPPVINEQTDDPAPVVPAEDTSSDTPEPTTPSSGTLSYSISANTNQDEQLALLTFEDSQGHTVHQSLVFFGQEGQQEPSAVPVALNAAYEGTVKLTYLGAFAGNSDANTGHTAEKIAIKDFGLGETGDEIQLASQSDGVNIGVGKSITMEASVQVENGQAGEWSFANPTTDVNDRQTYDGSTVDTNGGFDILDFTGDKLDLTALDGSEIGNFEVIALKGSAAQELTLSVDDVLKVTDNSASNVLHVLGGKEDTLNLVGGGWEVPTSSEPTYFGWVEIKSANATLLVDPDVNINVM